MIRLLTGPDKWAQNIADMKQRTALERVQSALNVKQRRLARCRKRWHEKRSEEKQTAIEEAKRVLAESKAEERRRKAREKQQAVRKECRRTTNPCEGCQHEDRCNAALLACKRAYQYIEHGGWNESMEMDPTRRWYQKSIPNDMRAK